VRKLEREEEEGEEVWRKTVRVGMPKRLRKE
jgi:hypothetical protein